MNIEGLIKENVGKLRSTGCKIFLNPDIPEKKLNNAIAAYASGVDVNFVLAVIDTTIFGSAKEGMLFTGNKLYFADINCKKIYDLSQIKEITRESYIEKDKEGKDITKYNYFWKYNNTRENITKMLTYVNASGFYEFIKLIVEASNSGEGDFESTNQACPLAMMSEDIKEKYLQLISNFAYSDDGVIDSKEYSEIMVLIALNSIAHETRIRIRSYMYDNTNLVPNEEIIRFFEENVDVGSIEALKLSLVKDIINLFVCKNSKDVKNIKWRETKNVAEFVDMLGIEDKKVDYIVENIVKNKEIVAKRQDDVQIKKNMQELVSKAGAVGVPLAAVYLSGSVIGVSAAGMTSGLAALGMGGVLGFSSMFTGIGVAVLLGVGAYKGIKKVTGMGELERNKQREMMLKEIAKNSQKALNYLIEDVNEISRELQQQLISGKESEIKIKKLANILAMMTQGAQETSEQIDNAEKESIICKLPTRIKVGLIEELAPGATKKSIRDLIYNAYSEERIDSDGSKIDSCLNTNQSYAKLKEVYDALEGIGFYSMAENSKAQAINTAKGFVKGIFG